jgi:sugar-specific transcriptional regulator TrmB
MPLEKLKEFGLSEKEALVYIALLELGTATVSEIAKTANINRSTTYIILESLSKKGLVNFVQGRNIRLYDATTPENLIQYLKNLSQKYDSLISKAKELVPQLKKFSSKKETRPTIKLIEGNEGIQTVYEDALNSLEIIRKYGSIENIQKNLPEFLPHYYKKLAEKNIRIQTILPDNPKAREFAILDQGTSRETFLIPQEKYSSSPEISIYNNKITFVFFKEKFALVIENQELADAFKKVFGLAWQEAKRLNKKSLFEEDLKPKESAA